MESIKTAVKNRMKKKVQFEACDTSVFRDVDRASDRRWGGMNMHELSIFQCNCFQSCEPVPLNIFFFSCFREERLAATGRIRVTNEGESTEGWGRI